MYPGKLGIRVSPDCPQTCNTPLSFASDVHAGIIGMCTGPSLLCLFSLYNYLFIYAISTLLQTFLHVMIE